VPPDASLPPDAPVPPLPAAPTAGPPRPAAEPPPLPPWRPTWRLRLQAAGRCARRHARVALPAALGLLAACGLVVCHVTRRRPLLKNCRDLARYYGKATGLDPALILAVIQAESAGDPKAVSRSGARGLMQLMPATAQEVATKARIPYAGPDDLFQPDLNVRLGTLYLAQTRRQFSDDPFLYLAAYNAGPGRIGRLRQGNPDLASWEIVATLAPAETRVYVRRVLRYWDKFREELARGR
jgi:soluble lytic murein transglycosylase